MSVRPGDEYSAEELQEALVPIASLIGKSEKAQQKLAPGTWQHTMLRDNVRALRIASALLGEASTKDEEIAPDDLRDALRAISSMIDKTEGTQTKFSPGTSQHTLQRNRLKALRIAQAVTGSKLEATEGRVVP